MCVTAVDDLFLCTVYHFWDDADTTVAVFFHAARHFVAQGIHQPRLTFRGRPDHRKTGFVEFLACSSSMLQVERTDLFTGEIAQAEGFRFDVERRTARNDVLIRKYDTVITNITDTAQDDALREMTRTIGITGTKLTQDAHQRISHQGVDFIDEKQQRTVERFA